MKLTGKLKKDVEKTENKEKVREIIAEAGMELTDDELEKVSGGAHERPPGKGQGIW